MATLERIRRRSGLLIIVIGFAMAAFILTDLLGSGNSIFNDNSTIGKIDGQKVDRQEFATRIDELVASNPQYGNFSSKQQADFVWNQLMREIIMGKEYDKLGFAVTSEELRFDLMNNPQVRQIQLFQDPNTGQFSEESYVAGLNYLIDNKDQNADFQEFWIQWVAFQKSVKDQSLVFKYNNAVEKGLYTPAALARADYIASSQSYNVSFIQLPYAAISDSTITVTDADKKAWYNAHKEEFKQEAVRNIEYINFPIAPSDADKQEILDELALLKENKVVYNTTTSTNDTTFGFAQTENDSVFAAMYSDQPVDMGYYTEGQLSPVLDTVIFDAEIGTLVGPYEEAGGFKMSKLTQIKFLPDSVKARHILIAYQGAERSSATRSGQEAKALADSLFEVLENDRSAFEEISKTYNDDVVAAGKGGDLGYFSQGQMAPAFNNYCFYNAKGDIGLVFTQFGFHIVEITDQKGSNKAVRVASIFRNVYSSEATMNAIYAKASTFASEAQRADDYKALADENGYQLRPATNIKQFEDQIPGLGTSRKIVQWAWDEEREEGSIGLIENNGQGYVVVILTDVFKAGYTPMDKVMGRVTEGATNQKKGEQLVKQIEEAAAGKTEINAVAQALNTTVKTQSLNRKSVALTGAGNEPVVIGTMVSMPVNTLSKPIAGERAAYMFVVTTVNEAYDKQDYADDQQNLNQGMRTRAAGQTFESIKAGVKIDDKRSMFY
jgi:parvulin-like peptidyl-prolyl isomerase